MSVPETRLSNRYEIVRELGRGRASVVYLARDAMLEREVAVKLIAPDRLTPEAERRFRREAQAVARLDHPAVVPVFDFGEHDGALFYVMPVLAGRSLRAALAEDPLRAEDVAEICARVAEAVDHCRALGVAPHGLRPEAVFVWRGEGGALRVRITAFGPSPDGDEDGEARDDIAALGSLLLECPAAAADPALEAIARRCLDPDPGRRFAAASEVAEALDGQRRALVSRPPAAAPGRREAPPLVGRDRELAELRRRLGEVARGESHLVLVSGEAGIGKSRMLDEIERAAAERGVRALRGRFAARDVGGLPYQGFLEALRDFLRAGAPADWSDLAPDLVRLFPSLAEDPAFARALSEAPPGAGEPRRDDRTAVFEVLARAVTAMAGGRPLALLLDDMHAADVSVEALQYVARRVRSAPVLLVATYRPSEVDRLHPLARLADSFEGDRRFALVPLAPLSPEASRALVAAAAGGGAAGGGAAGDALADAVFATTEGNPFFVVELVRSLADSGGVVRDAAGRLELSRDVAVDAGALPASIHQMVERQIARLPEGLRDLLSCASVARRAFDAADLAALAGGGQEVEEALERLARLGFLEERDRRGGRYGFASRMVRDVLYRALPRRRRRSLHRRFAEWLEARFAGRLERVYVRLLHHYAHADAAEKAVEYALLAARQALDAFSARDAADAARTALEFAADGEWDGDRALEGSARLLLAEALRMEGDLGEALREAERAVAVFEECGRCDAAVGGALAAAELAWASRRTAEAERWVARGASSARALGDGERLSRLLAIGATAANLRGDHGAARAMLAEAARHGSPGPEGDAPPRGGALAVALDAPILTASEPAAVVTIDDEEVLANVFEPLVAAGRYGAPEPCLCERWETIEGGSAFRFRLRAGARFSDGHPLTAEAVKRSFERAVRLHRDRLPAVFAAIRGAAELAAGAAALEGVSALGDLDLEIRLEEPLPIYPSLLTDVVTAVARVAGGGEAVGTGPFVVAAREPGRVLLERNAAYRGTGPLLDSVEFRAAPPVEELAERLRAGEVDIVRGASLEALARLVRDGRLGAALVDAPRKESCFAVFAARGPVTRRAAARRALAGVVRPQPLVWQVLGRSAVPAVGVIPPGMLGHDPGRKLRALSPEEAASLLGAAGAPCGTLRVAVGPKFAERFGGVLDAVFEAWAALGVAAEVCTPGMDDYRAALRDSEGIDVIFVRWSADFDDPDNFTHGVFHSRHGLLASYFCSPQLDELADRARAETETAAREALYRRFEAALLEAAAVVPLFHEVDCRLASRAVRGLRLRGSAPFVNYAELGKAPAPGAAARAAGTARVHLSADAVRSLDPALATTAGHGETLPNVFETLVRVGEGARVVPWLAEEFAAEEGGRRFRFRLRDGVRFHDGRRLTARDVRYSFERLLASAGTHNRLLLLPIRGARALADGRVGDLEGFRIHSAAELSLELEAPLPGFAARLTAPATGVVPEGCDGFAGTWRDGAAGTGPFRVAGFEPGRRLELERNPAYWREGLPRLERLVFLLDVGEDEALEAFRAGRLAAVSGLPPEAAAALRRDPDYAKRYFEAPLLSIAFLAFNARRGPLSDAALRRALLARVDAAGAVRRALGPFTRPARGFIPPGLPGYDAAIAEAAPAAADGLEIELTAAVGGAYARTLSPLVDEVVAGLARAGARVRIVARTAAEFERARAEGSADMLFATWVADYPDTDGLLLGALDSREGAYGRYCGSEEVDRLAALGRAEPDPAARHAIYAEAERAIARDALLLPLVHPPAGRFARPEVEGFACRSFGFPVVAYEQLRVK